MKLLSVRILSPAAGKKLKSVPVGTQRFRYDRYICNYFFILYDSILYRIESESGKVQ